MYSRTAANVVFSSCKNMPFKVAAELLLEGLDDFLLQHESSWLLQGFVDYSARSSGKTIHLLWTASDCK